MALVARRGTLGDRKVRVAAIGGGTGLPNLLRGIRGHLERLQITAIVTTFDDGGSSGELRRRMGLPGVGDIRRCLVALAACDAGSTASAVAEVVGHRFPSDAGMSRHALGNLVLARFVERYGGLSEAVQALSELLQTAGAVVPVATETGELRALLEDGSWVESESAIDKRACDESRIARVELCEPAAANREAVRALVEADVVTLGPGDLYTSVIANLLPEGIGAAINQSAAVVVYIGNILNKPAEAANFRASDYLRAINGYLQPRRVDVALFNRPADSDSESQLAVQVDDAASELAAEVHVAELRSVDAPAVHDSERLAASLLSVIEARVG